MSVCGGDPICIAAVYCALAKFSSSTHAAFSGCGPCVRPRGESRQSAMGKGPLRLPFSGGVEGEHTERLNTLVLQLFPLFAPRVSESTRQSPTTTTKHLFKLFMQ